MMKRASDGPLCFSHLLPSPLPSIPHCPSTFLFSSPSLLMHPPLPSPLLVYLSFSYFLHSFIHLSIQYSLVYCVLRSNQSWWLNIVRESCVCMCVCLFVCVCVCVCEQSVMANIPVVVPGEHWEHSEWILWSTSAMKGLFSKVCDRAERNTEERVCHLRLAMRFCGVLGVFTRTLGTAAPQQHSRDVWSYRI